MKSAIASVALFAAVALAQPHGHGHMQLHEKRDDVTITETVHTTLTVWGEVDGTATAWVTPGYVPPAEPTTTKAAAPTPKIKQAIKKPEVNTWTEKHTSSSAPYVAPVPTTTAAPAPVPTTTKKPYVAAKPTTLAVQAVSKPASSYGSKAVAKQPAQPAASKPAASASEQGTSSGSSSSSSSGGSGGAKSVIFSNYSPQGGYGSCGQVLSNSDYIVALGESLMKGEAQNSPLCGKTVILKANGITQRAKVADQCALCDSAGRVDLTPALYAALGGTVKEGLITDATWEFAN